MNVPESKTEKTLISTSGTKRRTHTSTRGRTRAKQTEHQIQICKEKRNTQIVNILQQQQ